MLKGKSLPDYTNLAFLNEYEKNEKNNTFNNTFKNIFTKRLR